MERNAFRVRREDGWDKRRRREGRKIGDRRKKEGREVAGFPYYRNCKQKSVSS